MKLGICNELFVNWPWEKICDFASGIGYRGIEVAPFTLADRAESITAQRRAALRESAESRGLEIIGLHWLLMKPPGLSITHPDAGIRTETARYFVELVGLCADLGGKVMVIGSPKQRNLLPGVKRDQAMGYAAEVFTPSSGARSKARRDTGDRAPQHAGNRFPHVRLRCRGADRADRPSQLPLAA